MEKFKYIAQMVAWLFVFSSMVTFCHKMWPEHVPEALEDAAVFSFACAMLFLWIDSVFDLCAWVWGLFK